jgi:hypothetical protein
MPAAPPRGDDASAPAPVFLVAAGRSGTTLLRHLLDAHADIGCPGEAGLPATLGALGRAWYTVTSDHMRRHVPEPTDEARHAMRAAVTAIMAYYCEREGKRIYCDKSLDSAVWLSAVHDVLPEARYIFLYRHVLDVIASGIEASPWGFDAFGYAAYVARSVENFVAPLAQHWISHVRPTREWSAAHPMLCHVVRYEDLVADPGGVISGVFEFLDVEVDLGVLDRAFVRSRSAHSPGDLKMAFTDRVHAGSVGRGRQVPTRLIPQPLLEEVNANLVALGYDEISYAGDDGLSGYGSQGRDVGMLDGVSPGGMARMLGLDGISGTIRTIALVADDVADTEWWVDVATGEVAHGRCGRPDVTLVGAALDLRALITGAVNGSLLLQSRRIRYAHGDGIHETECVTAVRIVCAALRRTQLLEVPGLS